MMECIRLKKMEMSHVAASISCTFVSQGLILNNKDKTFLPALHNIFLLHLNNVSVHVLQKIMMHLQKVYI